MARPAACRLPTLGRVRDGSPQARKNRQRYTLSMNGDELRRWAAGRRAAEARELAEAGARAPEAIAEALALVALCGRLLGWPIREDVVAARDSAQAQQSWATLRARWCG